MTLEVRRGDIVVVALSGDYGKPRPAVVVQTDAIPANSASVLLCPLTTSLTGASDLRLLIAADEGSGLVSASQVMADKIVAVRREKIGRVIGRLTTPHLATLSRKLAFVLGLSE